MNSLANINPHHYWDNMGERVQFFELSRQGSLPDDDVQAAINQERTTILDRTNTMVTALLKHQDKSNEVLDPLAKKAKDDDFLRAVKFQCQNLETTLQQKNEVVSGLKQAVQDGALQLQVEKNQKKHLLVTLHNYRQLLNRPTHGTGQQIACAVGERTSRAISNNIRSES